MIAHPNYASHAEQQAHLGCAAILDPARHPRRYALHMARKKRWPRDSAAECAPEQGRAEIRAGARALLAEKAKAYSHMTIKEAAGALGITRDRLRKLRSEFGLVFCAEPAKNTRTLDLIEKLAAAGMKIADIADRAGVSFNYAARVVREHGFKRGPQTVAA